MEKLNSLNPEITFYIRTAKKLGFIQKSKKSVLNSKQVREIAQKKTKIPAQNQILYYNGEEVKQNKNIKIVDKSIVHVIDSRNVGKLKMKLSVKRLSQISQQEDFQVDSNTSIDEFIKKELEPFYGQPAEKLFFVYSGRQLKRQKSFSQEHVESETEIVCVHAEKDRKNKKKTVSNRSSANSLHTKDTLQTKTEQTPKKEQVLEEGIPQTPNQKNQHIVDTASNQTEVQATNVEQQPQKLASSVPKTQQQIIESHVNEEQVKISPKNVIKSIEQIQCDQIESDQESDNEADKRKVNIYPQKLPEEYLMEQTRSRSSTKSDHNNNSGSSSISEPNFKKKKKASEVEFIKSSEQKRQEQTSPKSLNLIKSPSDNSPSLVEKNQQQKPQTEKSPVSNEEITKEVQNRYKTRDQIFENNSNTFTSVIDEPEESPKGINMQSSNLKVTGDREEVFNPYYNRQEEEIYDSQMNYCQVERAKMEVRGFMNFSSASFLEPYQMQTAQTHSYENHELSFGQTDTYSGIRNNESISQIHNRAPQFLANENSLNPRRQYSQQMGGDSLSFSKEQSEMKASQQNEDNLFVDYRRGPLPQRNNNIMIHDPEVSESNLLSETYNNQNATQMMNSITFNLEPNPDDVLSYQKQSEIHIIDEDEMEQPNQVAYEKRDSQVETNVRDSANPSQIFSNNSSQINQKPFQENISIQPMSLIDGLASMIEDKVNVNAIDSQDSLDGQENQPKQNHVDPGSDISYDHENQEQVHEQTIQTIANHNTSHNNESNMFLQENSNVFVQFQAYTANLQSSFNNDNNDNREDNELLAKQNDSNLLDENSFAVTHERSLENGFLKRTLTSDSDIHVGQYQNQAIKIVQEDSLLQQDRVSKHEDSHQIEQLRNPMNNEEMEHSAAFHEISQSMNNEKIQESSNFINIHANTETYDVSFRKDHKSQERRFDADQGESRMEEPQGSKLLYELSLQAMNQTQQPQLLPGDYIYSTDRVQSPEQALDSILNKFAHCL